MNSRSTEFITVLAAALVIGLATGMVLRLLQGKEQTAALVALGAVVILTWRYLGRRFGRR